MKIPNLINAFNGKEPTKKIFVAIDKEGSHGTSGTPQTFGVLCWVKDKDSPKVEKNHKGTVMVYPNQALGLKPQQAEVAIEEPIINEN